MTDQADAGKMTPKASDLATIDLGIANDVVWKELEAARTTITALRAEVATAVGVQVELTQRLNNCERGQALAKDDAVEMYREALAASNIRAETAEQERDGYKNALSGSNRGLANIIEYNLLNWGKAPTTGD